MSISSAKSTFGLDAVGTGTRPMITQNAVVGQPSTAISLPSDILFAAEVTLNTATNVATVNTETFATTVTASAMVLATGTLTLTGNAVADETVTVGGKVYTWKATVSTTANEVKIGATASDSLDNLIAAVNTGAGSGTLYGSATTVNVNVSAAAGAGDTAVFTSALSGTAGNAIATTDTMTLGSFGGSTLTGGKDANGWDGASEDFEGGAFPSATNVYGMYVKVVAGIADIDVGTGGLVSANTTAGSIVQIANASSVPELTTSTLTITADVANTVVQVVISAATV